jgi:hypothetical protein
VLESRTSVTELEALVAAQQSVLQEQHTLLLHLQASVSASTAALHVKIQRTVCTSPWGS